MATEKTLVRINPENCSGELALGPFLVGKAYEVPTDYAALLDKRFERATLGKDEAALQLDARHLDCLESLSALKGKPASALAPAKADALPKPTPTTVA